MLFLPVHLILKCDIWQMKPCYRNPKMEVDNSLQWALQGKPVPENISVSVSQTRQYLHTTLL